jgi:hypothetical protein
MKVWHNAELASRALSWLTSNFARHCTYNMIRIAQNYSRSPSEFPSDTLLKKQKFVLSVVSDATRDRMHLIGTKLIFRLEALFLRLLNFNIEIYFVLKNKLANNDTKKVLAYIFLKNGKLAEVSHESADQFDKLIGVSMNMHYWEFIISCRTEGLFLTKMTFNTVVRKNSTIYHRDHVDLL